MNLSCGRNPWKRASFEDSTFRAYMKDPRFLRTILPLSPELDCILRRVFEFNPSKRITIPELRYLIQHCPRFTSSKSAMASPLPSPTTGPVGFTGVGTPQGCYGPPEVSSMAPLPPPYASQVAHAPYQAQSTSTGSSGSDDSVFSSSSSISSASSSSSFTHVNPPLPQKVPVQAGHHLYVSSPTPNAWFTPFFQAAGLVKRRHACFQPPRFHAPLSACG